MSGNTCPYTQEDQALKLIAELESQKLKDFEQSIQAMQAELQQISTPRDPTDALNKFATSGSRDHLLKAVFAQPYLKQVPEAVKVRLCEELPGVSDKDGWEILKRLPLSRSRRRSLCASRGWVVSLCSGPSTEGDPLKLWAQERNLEYLPIDLRERGGRGWDLCAEAGPWSVLLWAAAQGRISAVLSSPPYRTWNKMNDTPRTVQDPWAGGSTDPSVTKESLLAVQDLFLWSLASVARGQAIPYLKESPSTRVGTVPDGKTGMSPEAFWETEAWKTFQHWARVRVIDFCQGSLGHSWLRPTIIGTNLSLNHLQGIPRKGDPSPPIHLSQDTRTGWCLGFKKEIVEALDGRVKGPRLEELDRTISKGLSRAAAASERGASSPSTTSESRAEDSPRVLPGDDEGCDDAEVNALKPDDKEAWRAHIMRGHLPYRRDCQFCVEGSGLGVQHRKVKNPQAFTLSVDLFGPMPSSEKGRDEQSVSGNPHLRFGLVGVFRMPKSMITAKFPNPKPNPDEEDRIGHPLHDLLGALDEYEPTDPGLDLAELSVDELEGLFGELEPRVEAKALDVPFTMPCDMPEDRADGEDEEFEYLEDDRLEAELKDATSGVELVTLRYFVGLKSKSGADVTAGIQQLVLRITQRYPLRILHCDPGTEFTSDVLSRWLPGQGIRLQTTIPTDKQGNGLAERMVGWFKARARTLIAANDFPVSHWPLAMRWASESYNRTVLGQEPLPAFGQVVLHKLKRPPGANKELLTRWVRARYGAPHLTIPEGHVLVTSEGSLVASKGFRTGIVDPKILEEAAPAPLQEVEGDSDHALEEPPVPSTPSMRLREKTTVRFVEEETISKDLEAVAESYWKAGTFTEEEFREVMTMLQGSEVSTTDRRGDFEGRFVIGAYCHGGQRGVTTLCRQRPNLTKFLNGFLRSKIRGDSSPTQWASLLLMHATDVPMHRDFRNEWGTKNFVLCVPGSIELWTGPPHDPKIKPPPVPLWDSADVVTITSNVQAFDPRCYHAVRRNPDWVIVGYSPLGVHKLSKDDQVLLKAYGFDLPGKAQEEHQVRALRSQGNAGQRPTSEQDRSSSSSQAVPCVNDSSQTPTSPQLQGPLSVDEQPDNNTPLVAWDLSEGASRNQPSGQSLPKDLKLFLWERDIQYIYPELRRLGVDEPEDLIYLFVEDLIELGLSPWEAERVMFGVHPPGTRRPDNPNNCGLRTGEVPLRGFGALVGDYLQVWGPGF